MNVKICIFLLKKIRQILDLTNIKANKYINFTRIIQIQNIVASKHFHTIISLKYAQNLPKKKKTSLEKYFFANIQKLDTYTLFRNA